MASIRYSIQSKNNPATIYLRLSIDRSHIFKRKTPLVVNPKNWSIKRGKALDKDIVEKNLNLELSNLEAKLIESLNLSQRSDEIINSSWLEEEINIFFNKPTLKKDEIDYSTLSNYLEYFLSEKDKEHKKGLISLGTLKKYKTAKNNLIKFQNYSKTSYKISDINRDFIDRLEKFCNEVLKYNTNTTGRFVRFVKGVAVHARDNKGIKTSIELNAIKGYTAKVFKIYLSFEELDLIEGTIYSTEYLNNAKDWLIIGCYTGQRVSDLLHFSKDNNFQKLKKNVKKVMIYDGIPNSFAVVQAHNMIFLNAHKENDEVFFLDHILHEGSHVVFNTLTYNTRSDLFNFPLDSKVSEVTQYKEDHGDIYVRLHALFTHCHINSCMETCLKKEIFEGRQHYELIGRFSRNMKSFGAGVQTLNPSSNIYQEGGLKWYLFFKQVFENIYSKNHKLVNSYDVSNQSYVFSYNLFKEANPL